MRAASLLCILLVLTVRAHAVFDVFLQVTAAGGPTLAGTVTDPLYSGWIEAVSFEAATGKTATINTSGVTTGLTQFKSFTLVKKIDTATARLFSKLAAGTVLSSVKMVVVQRSPNRVELWDINATTCVLQKQGISAASGASDVEESITFLVAGFEWSYVSLKPNGDPLQEYFANWSLVTGTGASGTRTPIFPGGVDTDGDGIPDGWELFYGLNKDVADAALDSDGDGLDNLHEYIAHTDPMRPESVLRVTAILQGGGSNYLLSWQSVAGMTYRIESAPAPGGPWTFVRNVASAGTGTTTTTVTAATPQTFFRIVTP